MSLRFIVHPQHDLADVFAALEEGVRLAEQLIDSGAASRKLSEFISRSNEVSV